jgi:HEAT repeat protein
MSIRFSDGTGGVRQLTREKFKRLTLPAMSLLGMVNVFALSFALALVGCSKGSISERTADSGQTAGSQVQTAEEEADRILKEMHGANPDKSVWKYVEALALSSEHKQHTGAESINDFAKDAAVACALVHNLSQSTPGQARIALFMLTEIGEAGPLPQSCMPEVIDLFKHCRPDVRVGLISPMEESTRFGRNKTIITALMDSLSKDSSADVRQYVGLSLGRLGDEPGSKEVFDALCRSLASDKDDKVKGAALSALSSSSSFRKNHATEIVRLVESRILSKDAVVRKEAIEAASRFGNGSSAMVPALIEVLHHPDEKIGAGTAHAFAARSLGAIGPLAAAAVPALRNLLHEDDVTNDALVALGNIGPKAESAVPDMIPFLEDKNATRSTFALDALDRIGSKAKPALPALKRMIADPHQPNKIRLKQVADKIESAK